MPHGRMQRTAALPCGKSCSAYAANLFVSTLKKNFWLTIFQLTLKKMISELRLIFLSDWLLQF